MPAEGAVYSSLGREHEDLLESGSAEGGTPAEMGLELLNAG